MRPESQGRKVGREGVKQRGGGGGGALEGNAAPVMTGAQYGRTGWEEREGGGGGVGRRRGGTSGRKPVQSAAPGEVVGAGDEARRRQRREGKRTVSGGKVSRGGWVIRRRQRLGRRWINIRAWARAGQAVAPQRWVSRRCSPLGVRSRVPPTGVVAAPPVCPYGRCPSHYAPSKALYLRSSAQRPRLPLPFPSIVLVLLSVAPLPPPDPHPRWRCRPPW